VPWQWGSEQEQAFRKLKELILAKPCLVHTNLDKTFRLDTNTSNTAYGAMLSQKQENGKFHPVEFMLKSMLPAEQNYNTYDREVLIIVRPLLHWQY
jgi:hypothetical protein